MAVVPRYPIYVPTKGRANAPLTISMFIKDDVDFHIVVEPQEVPSYKQFGEHRLLVLPENNRGLPYARNWIKDHSISRGAERHWQFDDDVRSLKRIYRGFRIKIKSNIPLAAAEDFADRYENVGLVSFNSSFFLPVNVTTRRPWPPFYRNCRCYTNFLVLNSLPYRWRHRYNEDTDMSLQVLAGGWCTLLINAFAMDTPETMTYKGGQTDIYVNDGRLQMARQLERVWPGVVTTTKKWGRPQHNVKKNWRMFDTPLKLKPGIDLSKLPPNEYGAVLKEKRPATGRSRRLVEEK